ncbi:MAG: hypothetical protein EOM68_26435 [Spirochaetia bacterium]|nr:hypothetical protein [Spirochaetia bacterium]
MTEEEKLRLENLGFRYTRNGTHSARTIMIDELELLFEAVDDASAPHQIYFDAIVSENCLGKQSGKTRILTAKHLIAMYGLDPDLAVFRLLRFFVGKDEKGSALSAALCAFARDPLFRVTVPYICSCPRGARIEREVLESFLEEKEPGRYSPASLTSISQNINSSWTKTGHLSGRGIKIRTQAEPTIANTAYAVILATLMGYRGKALFDSDLIRMLDVPAGRAMELAQQASEKGWLIYKRIGDIIEVGIPNQFSIPLNGGSL